MSPFRMDGSPTLLRLREPSSLPLSVSVGVREDGAVGFFAPSIGTENTGSRRREHRTGGWVAGSGRTKDGLQAKEAVRTLIAA